MKKTANGVEYKTNGASHTHVIDPRDKEIKIRLKAAKESAATTNKTTRELYSDGLAGIAEEVVGQMPSASAFSKTVRRQRKNDYPNAPKNLGELVLPEIFTLSGENFLIYDNGKEKSNRLIIFGTQQALDFMVTCPILNMDGTVSSGPVLFDQIYVIHGNRWLTIL